MKIYKDKKTELEDVKSTGWSFCLVGAVGMVALILVDLDIIKLQFSTSSKIITSITMGILFIIFLFVGIKSFLSLKKTSESIDSQHNLEKEITSWFQDNCISKLKMVEYNQIEEEETDVPDFYFYSELIKEELLTKYPDLKEEFVDYMVEKLYGEMFPE